VSPDGRWVAFASAASNLVTDDRNSVPDIFLRDCLLGTTTRISSGPTGSWVRGESSRPCVSANGRIVAFASKSRALTPPDTNGVADMFAWDRGH
jgi:Tol biopolymer transport system component